MIKTFPIEFIRQALEQTLLIEHINDINNFGGPNQIGLFTFYEQLKTQDEVDRFVERYRDLVDQQNRSGLIGNGVLVSPENPTITNLYTCMIIPLTWTCSIRTKLKDRDQMLTTLFNLIEQLKGSKCDMAELHGFDENNKPYVKPFMVGTIGHNDNAPTINNGDYIGDYEGQTIEPTTGVLEETIPISDFAAIGNDLVDLGIFNKPEGVDDFEITTTTCNYPITIINETDTQITYRIFIENGALFPPGDPANVAISYKGNIIHGDTLNSFIDEKISDLATLGIDLNATWLYFGKKVGNNYELSVAQYDEEDEEWKQINSDDTHTIIFPEEHENFIKYKLSLSFDSLRCDEPRTLNSEEYCEISFGGSGTITDKNVRLGNDLIKVKVSKLKIVADTPIEFENAPVYYLEPLEMPSGNNANTQISQLMSNNFKQNTHTDGINLSIQYSFIVDETIDIISQWFEYARYGTYGTDVNSISPNMIYDISEIWSYWGEVKVRNYLGKIVEQCDIENSESDTLTLGLTFQIQGENN